VETSDMLPGALFHFFTVAFNHLYGSHFIISNVLVTNVSWSSISVSLTLYYWYLTDKVLSLSYTVPIDLYVYWGMYKYGYTLSLMLVLDGSGLPVPCPWLLYPWERALLPIVQEAHFRYIYKVTAEMFVSSYFYISLCGVVHLPPDNFLWKLIVHFFS